MEFYRVHQERYSQFVKSPETDGFARQAYGSSGGEWRERQAELIAMQHELFPAPGSTAAYLKRRSEYESLNWVIQRGEDVGTDDRTHR